MMLAAGRPRADDLGPGPDPGAVLVALAGEPGLACLWGSWLPTGTGVLLLSGPRAISSDPAVLDRVPTTQAPGADVDAGVVGGGWLGWLGYDAPHHLAYYDHLLRFDDDTGRWSFEALWTRRRARALRRRREELRVVLAVTAGHPTGPGGSGGSGGSAGTGGPTAPSPELGRFAGPDRERHLAAVEGAIGLIRAGEIYQANVCTRLGADFAGSAADAARLFARAAAAVRPRFGAFIDSGDRAVLSLSPELFLRHDRNRGSDAGDTVTSSPIKGTWRRDPGDPAEDGAERLRHSAKDVAENIMIVDLVRNDLGRVCRPGTVRVEQLLGVQPHPGVWHLVSTVAGQLRADVGAAELIAATFPPGSVTGAPKVRAVRAIADLEDGPRGVYTGAIGLAGPASGLLLSVAIRTFELAHGRLELGVGGGITVDSVPELEWRECAQKALPLLAAIGAPIPAAFTAMAAEPQPWQRAGGLIETLLAVDGQVLRLADHLARLDRSARELYGAGVPPSLAGRVRATAADSVGRIMVRIVFRPSGSLELSADPARPRPPATEVHTVRRPGVWRHKWADRSWIETGESAQRSPLYLADDGTVLETARGNVFVLDRSGGLLTPPLRDDLLPGVTRRAVLDLARDRRWPVRLESFPAERLLDAAAAFWTSSLSGVVPITAVDGRPVPLSDSARRRLDAIATGLGSVLAPEPIVS